MDDRDLLRAYVERHSEPAFAELVARHLPGVLATAQRLLREPQAAADVAQTVFIQLARKAWTIREGQVLSGWLYRATRHAAFNALRQDQRRRQRETTAMNNAEPPTHSAPGWADLAPLVDEALRQLQRPEQDVVLLRFFEGKSFAEIGRLLHLDEKTAGQRAHRALEKMRRYFSRWGVTTTALLLGSALGAHGATTLPAGMAAQVAGASLAGAGSTTSFALLLKTLYMTTSTKLILAAAVLVTVAAVSTITQQREISQLRAELASKNVATASSAKNSALSPADALAKAKARFEQILKTKHGMAFGREMKDFADSLDASTAKTLLDDIITKPPSSEDEAALTDLMMRWAELNPQAAFAWTQNIQNPSYKRYGLQFLFQVWSDQNPTAALAALTQLKNGPTSMPLLEVLNGLAQKNPQAALAALRSLPNGQSFALYKSVFQTWASIDPSAAAAAALNLPPSSIRSDSLQGIAGAWALQDPSSALAWAKSLPSGSIQNGALTAALESFGQQDPSSAAAAALQLPGGSSRDLLLQNITSNWAQADPASLLTWADTNLSGNAFDTAAKTALYQMGQTDPVATAAALAQLSDPNVVNQAIPALARNWAIQDAQAALAWAQSLPADNVAMRNTAITDIFSTWSMTDPPSAATYIQQNLANDPSFKALATQAVGVWANSDPQAALNWAQSLPVGDAQDNAVSAAITALAAVDPQTAWNDAQQLSGSTQDTAMVNVINAWAAQQPAQAAAALTNLPQGANLNTATGDVAKSWLSQDPNAASQWIDTLPQGAARDSAVTQIISSVSQNDPASAFNWAVTLGDPTTRNTQVVKLATQWSNQNPVAAATAAQNALGNLTDLTAAQQTALQKVVAKAPAP